MNFFLVLVVVTKNISVLRNLTSSRRKG